MLAVIANWAYSSSKKTVSEHDSVHFHAGFKIFIDGVLQDYSDYKYMNFELCSEHEVKKSSKEVQIEKAHLHDGVGDVAHVHRAGGTWGDLFTNIGVQLPQSQKADDFLRSPIDPNSSVVLVLGNDDQMHEDEKVTIEDIKEVESKSELCGAIEKKL